MKNADSNYTTDYNAMQSAKKQNSSGIHNLGREYWLTSRYVDSYSSTLSARFYVRSVDSSGNASSNGLGFVNSSGYSTTYSGSCGIRPVITLKSGIQTSSGDGSETNAYKLVAQ